MERSVRHLLVHYSLLLSIFLAGGIALILFQGSTLRWPIIGVLTGTYIVWGIWHHIQHRTLTKDVVFEFGAMLALIGLILVFIS